MQAAPYRTHYVLRGTLLDPMDMPAPLELSVGRRPVQITFKGAVRATMEGDAWVNLCEAETVIAPRPEVREELRRLAERMVPSEARAEAPAFIASLVDETGRLRPGHALPIRFLPSRVRASLVEAEQSLFEASHRIVSVTRWRLAIPGPHQPLVAESHEWFDGSVWQELPFVIPQGGWPVLSGALGESWRREVERLAASGPEPLAQELYREASTQRTENPRSAVVLAVTAAEVGVIHTAVMLEVPLPTRQRQTFRALLEETVPRLAGARPIAGRVLAPPPALINSLRSARALRNRIVHRGVRHPPEDAVNDALESARNLLLFLDFYAGHGWALSTADSRLLAVAARAIGLNGPGDLLRAAWSDARTISPFLRPDG